MKTKQYIAFYATLLCIALLTACGKLEAEPWDNISWAVELQAIESSGSDNNEKMSAVDDLIEIESEKIGEEAKEYANRLISDWESGVFQYYAKNKDEDYLLNALVYARSGWYNFETNTLESNILSDMDNLIEALYKKEKSWDSKKVQISAEYITDGVVVHKDGRVNQDWKKRMKTISKEMESSKPENVYERVKKYAVNYAKYDPAVDEIESFTEEIINEYQSGEFEDEILSEEFFIETTFKLNSASEYYALLGDEINGEGIINEELHNLEFSIYYLESLHKNVYTEEYSWYDQESKEKKIAIDDLLSEIESPISEIGY